MRPRIGNPVTHGRCFPSACKVWHISERLGYRPKQKNLLHRRNRSSRTQIECHRHRTGKHDPCQSKVGSIEIVQETGISKFTSSQYKGVRPSIVDWDRTIRCTRVSSYIVRLMRDVPGHFKFTYFMQQLHCGGPGKSSAGTQCVCCGVQRRDNDKMARCGSIAKGSRQCLWRSRVSDRKRWKRA